MVIIMMSIRNKMLLLIITALLFVEVGLGGIAFYEIQRLSDGYVCRTMNLLCERNAYYLDQKLERTRSAVRSVKTIAEQIVENPNEIENENVRNKLQYEMVNTFNKIIGDSDIIRSYYFRYARANIKDEGFYHTRDSLRKSFSNVSYRTMNDEGENDEQFQWYYQTLSMKNDTWIEPHKNIVVNKQVISYASPFFVEGEMIGVVGVDLDFNDFIHSVRNIQVYDKGYAFLSDGKEKMYWHYLYPYGTNYHFKMYDTLKKDLTTSTSQDRMLHYRFNDADHALVFVTLSNGMKLFLTDETEDLFKDRNLSIKSLIVICTIIAIVFSIIPFWIERRYVKPIEEIIKSSHKLAEGDYDVHIKCKSKDEMGLLAESFNMTAMQLKIYFNRLENRAYRDELTGVKNHAAYSEKKNELEIKIKEDNAEFAIVLVDMNNLKVINDNYGHYRGDEAIKNTCHFICELYDHSPVYRIGGDEFVVIIENSDYRNRDELFKKAREKASIRYSLEPWIEVSIASGMGIYKKGDTFLNVFARADFEMYRNKQENKKRMREDFF